MVKTCGLAVAAPDRGFKRVLKIAALWLFCGIVIGALGSMIYGEFGSVVVIAIGVLVGVSGATAHNVLVWKKTIDQRSYLFQVLTLWIGALLLPAVWIVIAALTPPPSGTDSMLWTIGFLGGIAAEVALVASAVVCWFVRHRPA